MVRTNIIGTRLENFEDLVTSHKLSTLKINVPENRQKYNRIILDYSDKYSKSERLLLGILLVYLIKKSVSNVAICSLLYMQYAIYFRNYIF